MSVYDGSLFMVLGQDFFERSVLDVAPDLLGKFLVRRWRGKEITGMITEVEAYDGEEDEACHGSRGFTPRTKVMFGPAGRFYVYFVYGMHWMLNVVTGEEGYPAAVLIRGVKSYEIQPRKIGKLVSGPGRVTRHFRVGRALNGKLVVPESGLWVEDRGFVMEESKIKKIPRIGVDYAGPVWSKKLYRFVI